MSALRRLASTAALLLTLLLLAPSPAVRQAWAVGGPEGPPTHAEPMAPICSEDMPCWTCASMGNRLCSPASLGTMTGAAWVAQQMLGHSA